METRPEQPPEGKLIADAADRMDLSIREAARRAGISYGRWRQIVTGYQNVSPGSYAAVRAPAKTLAKMARVVHVTPEQMAAQGQRPDAAALMVPEPAEPATPRRRVLPELEIGPGEEAEVARYRLVVDAERDGRFPPRNAQENVVWETDLLDEHEKRSLVALLRHMEDRSVRQRDENSG
jgi:hypothetical protein